MQIVYGSQYYRPPEPSPDACEQDFARMRETGLTVPLSRGVSVVEVQSVEVR